MRIKVEIIQGFLESGKTSFINSMLKSDELKNERILVILNEYGEKEINVDLEGPVNIKVLNESNENMKRNYILDIIKKYDPDRIFIECNGMTDSSELINMLKRREFKDTIILDDVICIINLSEFYMYYRNMKDLMYSKITNSTIIILNEIDKYNKEEIHRFKKNIKGINNEAKLIKHSNDGSEDYYEELDQNLKIIKMTFGISSILVLGILFILISSMDGSNYIDFIKEIKNFYNIFVSLIIEGIPFILIGSILSSIIQIIIPEKIIMKIFPRDKILSCITASIAGIFLPICDCGTIPIMKSLIKKGVNIGSAITFMLAAPIVNPICIISTYYAFGGDISVIMYRIILGISISVICGLVISFIFKNDNYIYKDRNYEEEYCSCCICKGNSTIDDRTVKGRIFNIINHSTNEFFNVSKYMIFGMFICSILQSTFIKNVGLLPNDERSGLIVMMLLGFILSVCSTSDAFIARGFLNTFSINSVMGFLVAGPMIDLKNLIVLSNFFKRKFIFKLVFIIFMISFILMINFNIGQNCNMNFIY